MHDFRNPTRRGFLKATAAVIAYLILPKFLWAGKPASSYWFLHADSGNSWPVADPVQWSLDNARQPVLERASERLVTLTPNDGERIIRLVTRRCRLNLIEVQSRKVVVHYWTEQGLADLRPWFKAHKLARRKIKVVVRDRKREIVTTQRGDDFLFGDPIVSRFIFHRFLRKWHHRFEQQRDDWSAAPLTGSGYAWEGLENNLIPWAALKSAWRRAAPLFCLNCGEATVMVNFGFPWCGMFNRYAEFHHVCRTCHRGFRDDSIKDVPAWMVANLDAEVWPDYDMVWDRRKKLELKA